MNELDMQRIDQKLDTLTNDVRAIKRHVVGESDPEHSLIFRVADHGKQLDEIRADKKAAMSLAWTALGTAVTAAVAWGWTRLTGHHP